MFIHASDVRNRTVVRDALSGFDGNAEVWQSDGGALLIGETPTDDDWRMIGAVAEYANDIGMSYREVGYEDGLGNVEVRKFLA